MNELDWDDALNMIGAAARFLKLKGAHKASTVISITLNSFI